MVTWNTRTEFNPDNIGYFTFIDVPHDYLNGGDYVLVNEGSRFLHSGGQLEANNFPNAKTDLGDGSLYNVECDRDGKIYYHAWNGFVYRWTSGVGWEDISANFPAMGGTDNVYHELRVDHNVNLNRLWMLGSKKDTGDLIWLVSYSDDSGENWSAWSEVGRVTTTNSGDQSCTIGIDNLGYPIVCVCYEAVTSYVTHLKMFKATADDGSAWGSMQTLTPDYNRRWDAKPRIVGVLSGAIFVIYAHEDGVNHRLRIAELSNDCTSIVEESQISYTTNGQYLICLDLRLYPNGHLYAFWFVDTATTDHVYYAKSVESFAVTGGGRGLSLGNPFNPVFEVYNSLTEQIVNLFSQFPDVESLTEYLSEIGIWNNWLADWLAQFYGTDEEETIPIRESPIDVFLDKLGLKSEKSKSIAKTLGVGGIGLGAVGGLVYALHQLANKQKPKKEKPQDEQTTTTRALEN